jgi:hypothetical protein
LTDVEFLVRIAQALLPGYPERALPILHGAATQSADRRLQLAAVSDRRD